MKRLALGALALALAGCSTTINASAPISATANTQVDQRQGTFQGPSGQVMTNNPSGASQRPFGASQGSSSIPGGVPAKLSFGEVKKFAERPVIRVLDFNTVVACSGTEVHVTTDAGLSWRKYQGVGSSPITAAWWLDTSIGWVGFNDGTVLKVSLVGSEVSTELLDSGELGRVEDIAFVDAQNGFAVDSRGIIIQTTDGGASWSDGTQPFDGLASSLDSHRFILDGQGGLVYQLSRYNGGGGLAHYTKGAFTPIKFIDGQYINNVVAIGGQRAFVNVLQGHSTAVEWQWSDDWNTTTKIDKDLKTPSKFIRNEPIVALYPIDANRLVGVIGRPNYGMSALISQDAGQSWSEPVKLDADFQWLAPFSESKMWAYDLQGFRLLRAGL